MDSIPGDLGGAVEEKQSPFGLIGLMVAILGLSAAVYASHATQLDGPRAKLADTLADAGDKFVGRMIDRVRKTPATPPARVASASPSVPWKVYLGMLAPALGLVGSASGAAGWIRREDHRMAVSAMVAGFLAVAWLYIIAALMMAVVLAVLSVLLGASHA